MNFDEIIDRRGTHCAKWDMMEPIYGVSPDDGLAMWVADTDFRAPPVVLDRMRAMVDHGVFGYTNNSAEYTGAICWWMENRHGWTVEPDWIFTTTGLVNGVGMCLDTFTAPGDGIVLFTPIYHAFAKVIGNAGRKVVECAMPTENGVYQMDFDAWDAQMTGAEKMVILCSPHNPGGRVWTREELQGVADFCKRHDLLLISDEIHHDLVFPGQTHIPMALVDPSITDRLIMLTAPSKTFNVAGLHTGNVIIPDDGLRAKFAARMAALNLAGNSVGEAVAAAAYSPEGAAWVDELMAYLDGNRKIFDAAINAIPGLKSMPLEATFLAWVDFSGTGMAGEEFTARVEQQAGIAANHGPTFGLGGDSFMRFNLGTQRARIEDACARLTSAFSDLQ
ncbi:MalY/PatB family protein [Antarcticimicrobium sediminis]|uniref:cysteine-S-conjugate beta-lyase n=1 Tax=Antarcticimicrobium sediminis TaxID=2546227 RepID=A0A4R5ERC9_9RHOB|nr:MalY/PatB family protein [Antarcticimicrobium sediminis]TDE37385.1 pyridoxal phosphate-dependent aminotransferase [Antarcticimicrobium sediminis]